MPKPLNVLMILADQHHADLMGCAGHPHVLTPHLDRFATSGIRFENAFCQNPICTPSRVSILSGQYCHNHGHYGLSGPANVDLPNLMRHFKSAGYRTAAMGKLHLPNRPRNWLAGDVDLLADSYETAEGEVGTSAFLTGLEDMGLRDLEDGWHNDKNYSSRKIPLDAMPSRLPYEHTQEVWSARTAMEFIKEAPNQPFCIQVAFQKPHHPLLPNSRFWELYPEDIPLPPSYHADPSHRPPNFRANWKGMREYPWEFGQPGDSTLDGPRRAWRGTLACISQIDDVFGKLLRFLDDMGLSDSTIVIYGSDHGCYHGIHGLLEKAPGICSDAICRIPLIWRVPGISPGGTVCQALVESVDIAPTLAHLCALPPMESADGLDIRQLLEGKEEEVRQVAVTENAWSRSIRWDNWRMVHYPRGMYEDEDPGELYAIGDDPNETTNFYNDPAHREVVAEGRRRLLDWLITTTRVVNTLPQNQNIPLCGDGRAPNREQPRLRENNLTSYL